MHLKVSILLFAVVCFCSLSVCEARLVPKLLDADIRCRVCCAAMELGVEHLHDLEVMCRVPPPRKLPWDDVLKCEDEESESSHIEYHAAEVIVMHMCDMVPKKFQAVRPGGYYRGELATEFVLKRQADAKNTKKKAEAMQKSCKRWFETKDCAKALHRAVVEVNNTKSEDQMKPDEKKKFKSGDTIVFTLKEKMHQAKQEACRPACSFSSDEHALMNDEL